MLPKAKKSYGQNWLVDKKVVAKIIAASEIVPGETVLEVGPGTGLLTQALVQAGARVIAVEADQELLKPLQEKFGERISLIHGDILNQSFSHSPPERPNNDSWSFPARPSRSDGGRAGLTSLLPHSHYKLIANIPYNITSDFLKYFLTTPPKPSCMILMLQREVAQRMTAAPPKMSLLSVVCQLYADCQIISRVPRGAFRPSPKVYSAIVRLDLHQDTQDQEQIIALAKLGFSAKRKQLHHNLSSSLNLSSQEIKDALAALGLDPKIRAEGLQVEDWVKLTYSLPT